MFRPVLTLCAVLLLALSACAKSGDTYERRSRESFAFFDTTMRLSAYTDTQEDFDALYAVVTEELARLHRLFDIYHNYEGLNNLKSINDNAGLAPVKVDGDIIALLLLYQDAYTATGGALNAAFGSVLNLWHEARESGVLPESKTLQEAAALTGIEKLVIDETEGTVFLTGPGMRLDVGAVAKGYAAQKAIDAARFAGYENLLLDLGGNISAAGKPSEREERNWIVGIQDPFFQSEAPYCALEAHDLSVVTSGGYQRFLMWEGTRYHHIIDPVTLYPAETYEAVSIIHADAGIADMLSTALFLLPFEEGQVLLSDYGGEALWIYPDGSSEQSPGFTALLSS